MKGSIARFTVAGLVALLALIGQPVVAQAKKKPGLPKAPTGTRFYSPPKKLVKGKAGTPIWVRQAKGLARPAGASKVLTVAYRSTSVRDRPTVMTGTIAIPKGRPPRGGWPAVTFGHVTTGAADGCAPSRVTPGNTELERLTRGDVFTTYLLERRVAVARADFEGIGTPGRHPYLIGRSLGRAMTDIVLAGRRLGQLRLGRRWAAAGHSEGGLGALFTARIGPRRAPSLSFRGVSAFAPASHISEIVELARSFDSVSPLTKDFSGLGALILEGAAVAEPSLWKDYRNGGLSPEALALLPDTQRYCLEDLGRDDSFGGIPPGALEGPEADRYLPGVYEVLDANDPRTLDLPGVSVRLDQGASDFVVWESHTSEVAETLAAGGADVTYEVWPGGDHQNITDTEFAAPAAGDWLIDRLR